MGAKFRLRVLIIVLVFVAVTAGGVATVFAFDDELTMSAFVYGSGTEDDPYRLYNATQFLNLQEVADSKKSEEYTKGKYFKLCADISATRIPKVGGGFYGTFDGDGHTIALKRHGLFYSLFDGGIIKNVNVDIDIKNGYNKYAVCYRVYQNAVIRNCRVKGNIDVDFTPLIGKKANAATFDLAVFSLANTGTIENCSYSGNITVRGGVAVGGLDIGIFAESNKGIVKACTADCDMDIKMTTVGRMYVCGIAPGASDSTYNGDISIVYDVKKSTYKSCRVTVYGLGRVVENCVYNGDIYLDMSYGTENRKKAVVAEEGTWEHNGSVIYGE